MNRTNELRKVIYQKLVGLKTTYTTLKNVYYRRADDDAMYPHIVYDFQQLSLEGLDRDDYVLEVDLFDNDIKRIEDIADDIEDLFKNENLPQTAILPTFFFESKRNQPDEDRDVHHILLRFTVQNYER